MLKLMNIAGEPYELQVGDKIIFDLETYCISFSAADNMDFNVLYFEAGDNKLFIPILGRYQNDLEYLAELLARVLGFQGVHLEVDKTHKKIFIFH